MVTLLGLGPIASPQQAAGAGPPGLAAGLRAAPAASAGLPTARRGSPIAGEASPAHRRVRASRPRAPAGLWIAAMRSERDRRADHDRQRRADARLDLVEDERQPQRLADMARDLEQPAVLAAEPYRHDRRLRALDELGHERLPAPVDRRLEPEPVRRGGDGAGGKHHHHAALLAAPAPPRGRRDWCARAPSCPLKSIGRMKSAASGARGSTTLVSTTKSRRTLLDQPGNHDAVEHAVGMIGDDHDRAGLRDRRERMRRRSGRRARASAPQPAEGLASARKAPVFDIEPLQLRLAGRLFDEPDQGALERRIARAPRS